MQKKMLKLEIFGIFFVIASSIFLQNLYELCGHSLIGIMFGAVNDSIWETAKTLLLPYLAWAMIELLSLRQRFHKFATIKILTLYILGASFCVLCSVYSLFNLESHTMPEFIAAILCTALSFVLSYKLLYSENGLEKQFIPALFLLFLFIALFCSLTPFPPKMHIFMDRATHLYGIIPENIDEGAIMLDTIARL
jgi:hypothetical protein